MRYEVPSEATNYLHVGNWVEIMESYDYRAKSDSIQVRAMRVGCKILAFSNSDKDEAKPLRPHEGRITFIENGPNKTLFSIRLR